MILTEQDLKQPTYHPAIFLLHSWGSFSFGEERWLFLHAWYPHTSLLCSNFALQILIQFVDQLPTFLWDVRLQRSCNSPSLHYPNLSFSMPDFKIKVCWQNLDPKDQCLQDMDPRISFSQGLLTKSWGVSVKSFFEVWE